MRGAIGWFAENHVAANLLMLFIIFGGLYVGLTMKLEVFPETDLDIITVQMAYPGASPAEVEEAVCRRIEEKVAGLAGIKKIESTAREGLGRVRIEVMSDWDFRKLFDEVKAEVDRITTFPEEAEEPTVRQVTRRSQVINVAVYGDVPEETLKYWAQRIKDDITELPGITLAEFFGVRASQIFVEVSEENLRRYGLTLGQVARTIGRASLDLPAGSVKTSGGEILIRTKGRRYFAEEYSDVAVLTRPDGAKVPLSQIADIRDDFEDVDLFALFRGKPSKTINVYRVADQNALKVARAVKDYLKEIEPDLPAGLEVDYFQDMSEVLKSRINLLMKNMAYGLILVSLLLGLFLNVRLAFWVTLGIPISFMFSLMFLPRFDVSINMISLFAFITVLGIVVDDAIIIGENIFRRQEEGATRLKGAVDGAIEVGLPVIFSVLTTVVAFWPLLLAGGMMGRIMRNLPVVVIAVLAGSLVESLFILPAHLSGGGRKKRQLAKAARADEQKRFARWLKAFINGPYAKGVDFCVRWRYAVIGLGILVLLLTAGMYTSGRIKFQFFPHVDSDVLQCAVTMPPGTPIDKTVEVVSRIERAAYEAMEPYERNRPQGAEPILQQSASLFGMQAGGHGGPSDMGSHLAHIWIVLLEGEQRDLSARELVQAWRKQVGPVPEADQVSYQSSLFRAGNPIEVHLSMDDDQRLLDAAEELKEELKTYPGVFDVADSFEMGKREMRLKLKPAARSLGLTLSDLAAQVRHAFYGAEALRFQRGQDEVKVMVRYPEAERRSLGFVENMRIQTPDGRQVPFSYVAEVDLEHGYSTIQRHQRRRVVKVTADVDAAKANANEIRIALENNVLPALRADYRGLKTTIEGEGKEQKDSLADVVKGFGLAMFMIYALLAVPFRSFSQPLIVMAAIPFGLAGAVVGHIVMGYQISMISMFGMVGLAGVVVNDSLVLIHMANQQRIGGLTAHHAVTKAGTLRFRAIILTSLTTFAGLSPMLVEKSLQARFLIPMAISLGFGVLFSTLVTLLLIPCGYMILEDAIGLVERMLGIKKDEGKSL